ncbi:MAG: formate dehydrogenase subunit alpha [Dehalococcoidia bacterium]|nr:formate dehydrogenase subunit alpha [Dehalococcoidia bacterium]
MANQENNKICRLTINGKQVSAAAGKTVLEAAKQAGIYIPTLCYHPSLKPYGGCRLCIVEIDGLRGYPTSCTTPVQDNMVVRTDTPAVKELRKNIFELIISEHPMACLTCHKNQRCELQQVASYIGLESLDVVPNYHNLPILTDSPVFDRDYNLCILCGRCVRVCQEIRGAGAIAFTYRGSNTLPGTAFDKPLLESDCQSCGACVDVCPTGALSQRANKWEGLPDYSVVSTCPYCGVGCQLKFEVKNDKIINTIPCDVAPNYGQACVKGRFGITEFVHHKQRLTTPLIRKNGRLEESSWEKALDLIVRKLPEYKGDSFAFISSAKCTNEDNYVAQKFARVVMQTNNIDHCARLCHSPTVTGLAASFGSGSMTNSIDEIAHASTIIVIGSNTTTGHPVIALEIIKAVNNGAKLILINPLEIDLIKYAHIWLQHNPGTDVALIMGMARYILDNGLADMAFSTNYCENFEEFRKSLDDYDLGSVQRITGIPEEQIAEAAKLYATHKPATIIYAMGITQHSHGTDNVMSLANLAMLTGNVGKPSTGINPLRGQNNVQGACDMGGLPNVFTGYQSVENRDIRGKFETAWDSNLNGKPGLTLTEIINAAPTKEIKCIYLMGENPLISDPDIKHVEEALKHLDFFIVQDMFLTETAQLADVVLPATSFAEKDGTYTNTERRVQRVRKVIEPIGGSRADWLIICQIARKMGARGFEFNHPASIMDEIAGLTPSYGGISYQRLETCGLQWPCPTLDHPGTPILHMSRFSRGQGRFTPIKYRPPAELPDEQYPFMLITGRSLFHFHTGTMTRKVTGLNTIEPEGMVEINREDATSIQVNDRDMVKVTSRRGQITIKTKISDKVPPKTLYMPFHFAESAANILTNTVLDPLAKMPEIKICAVKIEGVQTK